MFPLSVTCAINNSNNNKTKSPDDTGYPLLWKITSRDSSGEKFYPCFIALTHLLLRMAVIWSFVVFHLSHFCSDLVDCTRHQRGRRWLVTQREQYKLLVAHMWPHYTVWGKDASLFWKRKRNYKFLCDLILIHKKNFMGLRPSSCLLYFLIMRLRKHVLYDFIFFHQVCLFQYLEMKKVSLRYLYNIS